jgi:hypothetical protein
LFNHNWGWKKLVQKMWLFFIITVAVCNPNASSKRVLKGCQCLRWSSGLDGNCVDFAVDSGSLKKYERFLLGN